MTDTDTPTGVLLMAYGTPESPDDVEAYYTHIRGGRRPSPEAVEHLRARYLRIGGRSPLLDITRATASRLQERLDADTPARYRVYVGMRHWHPYIGDVVAQMAGDGVRNALALALAPHYARMSVGAYRGAVTKALAELDSPPSFRFVESWHAHPLFRRLIAGRIGAALESFPPEVRPDVTVVFSAHSLPERILTWDDPYPRELRDSAAGIAALAGVRNWRLAYQSAAATGEAWLGPDLPDALAELAEQGRRAVLSVPFGFVADHLEILYDVDVEAQERARALGMTLRRIALPNADPAFVEVLAALVAEHTRAG